MGRGFKSIKNILEDFDLDEDRFISREFQKYGYDLACELEDLEHKSLYILLAKKVPREFLEETKNFIKDQDPRKIKSKPRLFMWKLKEILSTHGLKMPAVRKGRAVKRK